MDAKQNIRLTDYYGNVTCVEFEILSLQLFADLVVVAFGAVA